MTGSCFIVVTPREVANLPSEARQPHSLVLAFSPASLLALRSAGIEARPASLTDEGHARCVEYARSTVDELTTGGVLTCAGEALSILVRQAVWSLAALNCRLLLALPQRQLWVWNRSKWVACNSPSEAIKPIFESIKPYPIPRQTETAPPWFGFIQSALTRVVIRRLGPDVARFMIPRHTLRMGVVPALKGAGLKPLVVEPSKGFVSDLRCLLAIARGIGDTVRAPAIPANDPAVTRQIEFVRKVGECFSSVDMRTAWQSYLPRFEANIGLIEGLARTAADVVKRLSLVGAFGNDAHEWATAAVFQGALTAGVPRYLVNHNSHPYREAGPTNDVLGELLANRCFNPLISEVWAWSPEIRKWGKHFDARGGNGRPIVPFRTTYPSPVGDGSSNRRFRVLHAGNYQNWSDFFPWVAETSFEFVDSLHKLAEAVAKLPEIELIVRIRPKLEVDAEVVRGVIPKAENITVCGTEEDFLTQLAGVDLLVSFFSTTVEQAAQMGKPVLLWGRTHRFVQLAARDTPPTSDDRGVIYAVHDAGRLTEMLRSLSIAHRKPLEPHEYGQYTFGSNVPDCSGLAAALAKKYRAR